MIGLSGSRALGYTGITNAATRPDHIARTFNIEIEHDENKRRFDEDLWTEFYENKPEILAYVFKIVSMVLAKYDEIKKTINMSKIRVLPDFELLCEVVSQCLGNRPNAFLDAWTSNRDEQVDQGLDSSMVAIVLEDYLREQYLLNFGDKEKRKISERPVNFYKTQLEHGRKMGLIKEGDKQFPQDLKIYGKELNRLKKSLEHIGIKINKETKHDGRRTVIEYSDYRDRFLPENDGTANSTLDDTLDSHNSNNNDNDGETFECYYCKDKTFKTENRSEYQTHVLRYHRGGICYPNYPAIVRLSLKPQGKSWELGAPPNPISS